MSRPLEKEIFIAFNLRLIGRNTKVHLKENLEKQFLGYNFCSVLIEQTDSQILVTIHREPGFTADSYRTCYRQLEYYLHGFVDGIHSTID